MNRYRIILKQKNFLIHSKVLERDHAPDAQEIFRLFDEEPSTHRPIRLLPKSFEEAMNKFTFEAYKLPPSSKDD